MNYEEKYNKALERAKKVYIPTENNILDDIFPELAESEDEKIRKTLIEYIKGIKSWNYFLGISKEQMIAWLEKQRELEDKGEISDGYHTFNELYKYRMLYNAAFFNLLPKQLVHKSKKHHDGKECFGGGWFIVMANLPTGQISNHYELKDWDLFHIPDKEIADEWDGHTPQEAAERLYKYLLEKQGETFTKKDIDDAYLKGVCDTKHELEKQGEQTQLDYEHADIPKKDFAPIGPKFKAGDWIVNNDSGGVCQVTEISDDKYCLWPLDAEIMGYLRIIDVDNEYHLWTIQDAKDGDVLVTTSIRNCPFIYRKTDYNNNLAYYYAGIDGNGDFCEGCIKRKLYHFGPVSNVVPATKEQRDLLFAKMREDRYEWDAEKKEVKKIEVTSENIEPKKLDPDKVIEWLHYHIQVDEPKIEYNEDGQPLAESFIAHAEVRCMAADEVVKQFKKDFGL